MNDIAVVMTTLDRAPRRNYLGETLENLVRGGVWKSPRLKSFWLVDSGSKDVGGYIYDQGAPDVDGNIYLDTWWSSTVEPRLARENVARALLLGADTDAPWILFCEDDIDVCADFLDSVGAWLDDHAHPDCHVYAFGAAYDHICTMYYCGESSWAYPIDAFYGTQCFALRNADARNLAAWLDTHPLVNGVDAPGAYDISMHEWAKTNWPTVDNFGASVPNFVQHMGDESSIGSGFYQFPMWPGRDWSYTRRESKASAR